MENKLGALSATLCVALILSCSPLFEVPAEAAGGSRETGCVVLSISTGGAAPARTVLPTTAPASRYELVFSRDGAEDVTVDNTADIAGTGVSQELAAGEWTAAVTAYREFTIDNGNPQEYKAAQGSRAITVAAGQITPVTVSLTPVPAADKTEKGIFTYKVSFPNGVTEAETDIRERSGG
jgi:hypothetical protein